MGVTLVILLVLALIYLLKSWKEIYNFYRIIKLAKIIKGPGLKELHTNTENGGKYKLQKKVLNWLHIIRRKYGPIIGLWFGLNFTVLLTDPEDIKCVLSSNQILHKSKNYTSLEPWLGKGLLISSGEQWHIRRKMLTPAFHFKKLSEFKQPMEDNCKIFLERLREKANGEAFDIYPYITLLTLDIICETAMGIKKNAQLQSKSEYVTAVENMCRITHRQSFSAWKRMEFLFKFTKEFQERQHYLNILHNETKRVIEMRRKAFKASNIHTLVEAESIDENGVKKRLAFLDILLLAQDEGADLTDSDIREEVDTFMFEGHDTTSSALSFAIYLLSQNQVVQQKAFEEAVALEGKEKDTMKYLEAVIKETLRLYPSVPFYSRLATEDITIRDLKIPKGTAVSILNNVVHRDERYFPEPDKFYPERFLVEENQLHPFAFIAFSGGPRNCIGQKFAMLELKCTLSSLLKSYQILPVENFVPRPLAELVTKSENGIQVRLRKRC